MGSEIVLGGGQLLDGRLQLVHRAALVRSHVTLAAGQELLEPCAVTLARAIRTSRSTSRGP
jgi:hypothetical protein